MPKRAPDVTVDLGYEVLSSGLRELQAGFSDGVELIAPAGKKIVGGGYKLFTGDVYVTTNAPSADGGAWEFGLDNRGAGETNYEAWAIAINVPPVAHATITLT